MVPIPSSRHPVIPSSRHLLGVHTHLFRGSPETVAGICRRSGLTCVQLTPAFPGLAFRHPAEITPESCRRAAEPFHTAGVRIACLSGNTNLLDPDLQRRPGGILRLHALVRHCRDFGTDRIVTESGSLTPDSSQAPGPDNHSPQAWTELRLIVAEALRLAADHGVRLMLKAESAQVLASATDLLRLREELPHPQLGFVLDPAGYLAGSHPDELDRDLERLVQQLGPWAPVVHAKDLCFSREGVSLPRAGLGALDYRRFFRLLDCLQPEAAIILEHLRPEEVDETKACLERALADVQVEKQP
jgi:sugar phosphate isomerase/epimerase